MLNKRIIELLVGLFILAGMVAVFTLAFKVSGFSSYTKHNTYHVAAIFDDIGDLKVRAPITIAGVRIGEVNSIGIDNANFKAVVGIRIDNKQSHLPEDTTAKILTAGLIGANYIELIPGYQETYLKEGDVIIDTQPALVLENLVSQLVYRIGDGKK